LFDSKVQPVIFNSLSLNMAPPYFAVLIVNIQFDTVILPSFAMDPPYNAVLSLNVQLVTKAFIETAIGAAAAAAGADDLAGAAAAAAGADDLAGAAAAAAGADDLAGADGAVDLAGAAGAVDLAGADGAFDASGSYAIAPPSPLDAVFPVNVQLLMIIVLSLKIAPPSSAAL
jgi:hypothetical protein